MKTLQGFSAQGPSATSASQRVVTRMNSEKSSHVLMQQHIKQWGNNSSEITYHPKKLLLQAFIDALFIIEKC